MEYHATKEESDRQDQARKGKDCGEEENHSPSTWR